MIISIILYSGGFVTTHIPDELLKFIQVVLAQLLDLHLKMLI